MHGDLKPSKIMLTRPGVKTEVMEMQTIRSLCVSPLLSVLALALSQHSDRESDTCPNC